jgi:ParB/Sulfiredoxin domain
VIWSGVNVGTATRPNPWRRDGLERLRSSAPARAPRNDPLPNLDLVYVSLEELRLPAREIRKLHPAHVREVANAISTLGFCAPVLVGKDNAVIDGAVRVEAARQLGLGRVPCVRVEHLSETEQRVLRLAVNRLGEKGEWNLEELKFEFEELIEADASTSACAPAISTSRPRISTRRSRSSTGRRRAQGSVGRFERQRSPRNGSQTETLLFSSGECDGDMAIPVGSGRTSFGMRPPGRTS